TAEAIASEDGADAVRLTPAQGAAFSIYGPAAALAAQTNSDLAGLYFTLTLALDPDLDVARNLLSDALERGERYEEAFEVLDPVPADSVFFAASRAQQAWLLRRLERNDEALNVAADALKEKPGRDLQMQLADLYRSVERYEEAEALFDEVVKADAAEGREDWRVMFARGAARERLERWPEAEADLLRALELSPNRPEVLNYLGYSWVDRGENIEEAFQLIKRAVDQRPDAGYIVDSLGWAYYRLGRYAEAVRYLEEAAELDPADPTINDHLGDAYWRVGRRDEARFQWARVLTLEAEAELVASVELKLDAGLDAPLVQTLAADTPPQVSDAQ
ncbi:MAG: tetratricopeptide repeat protein, partial [Pseudomonadota bacterium]